jgi:hypothetical protein
MAADSANPGWYSVLVPTSVEYVIVNANEGSTQTVNLRAYNLPVWVTVLAPEEGEQAQADLYFPGFVIMRPVFATIPDGWGTPHIWAWGPYGSFFEPFGWPGYEMTEDPNNPGWCFGHVPDWVEYVIISADVADGREQTINLRAYSLPVWVTVHTPEEGEQALAGMYYDALTTGPLPPMPGAFTPPPPAGDPVDRPEGTITVRVQIPDVWDSPPGVWAWNNDIGNAFDIGWPGPPMTEREGDWYIMEIPGWIDHIIINAPGGMQTDDYEVTQGNDLWIAIPAPGQVFISYYAPDGPVEAAPTPPPVAVPGGAAATPTPAPVPDDDNGGLHIGVIIAIIAGAVVVVGAVVFVVLKKKK